MAESAGGLPDDVVIEIGQRLTSIENYGSFVAVCKSWRAAVSTEDKKYLKNKTFGAPWLMLAEEEEDQQTGMRGFFSLASGKICKIFLPETIKKRCLSCQDWLFMVSEDEIHASLFHPVSRVQIHLPPLDTFPDYKRWSLPCPNNIHFIGKVVLSANPNSTSDFTVIVIWGQRSQLGYWKPGDTSWTQMNDWFCGFYDMIYYDNKLCALDYRNRFVTCDVNGLNPTKLHQVFCLERMGVSNSYLVEVSNKLLVLHRFAYSSDGSRLRLTRGFLVCALNMNDGKQVPKRNLWNRAIFLGHNTSFSVECSNVNKCKPNCIYYSDDEIDTYLGLPRGGGKDTGIYHLDGSIEPLINDIGCSKVTPPTWIGPSF